MRQATLPVLLTALWLGGCAVGPDYVMPALRLPGQWLGLSRPDDASLLAGGESAVGNLAWWRAFDDATLNRLIDDAVANNGSLRVAVARLEQARANRLAANAALLPLVSASASTGSTRTGGGGGTSRSSNAGLDASWELDLFGGNRRAAEAARANVAAADAARRQVRVSLLAEVANNYLDVRQLQQQVMLTGRNLEIQNETLRIVRAQYREGVASGLDLARAEGQVASTRAELPAAAQNLNAAVNNLGVLTGRQPADIRTLVGVAQPVPMATPQVLINTPASVLAQRPDVRQAERALAAATANEGVAISNWFPRLSVTALFGLVSGNSSFSNSQNVVDVGGTVSVPLIDFGRVRALVRSAKADQQAALATYEQTVLAALADVETALGGYVNSQRRLLDLQAAVDANVQAVKLAQARYREGVVPLLDVLTAQQAQFASDSTLAVGRAAVGQALATLYKALGGAAEPVQP